MRVYNKYVLSLLLTFLFIDVLLAFFVREDITVYFIANIVAYFLLTLLYVYFNPRVKRTLNNVNILFMIGLALVVVVKVAEIL